MITRRCQVGEARGRRRPDRRTSVPFPRSPRPGLAVLGAALAVLTALAPIPADAATTASPGATALPAPPDARTGQPRTVTLITGDKVTVTQMSDGHLATTVLGPNGGPVGNHIMTVGKETF